MWVRYQMMIVMEWGIMDIRVMLMNLEIPDQKVEMEGVVKMVMEVVVVEVEVEVEEVVVPLP